MKRLATGLPRICAHCRLPTRQGSPSHSRCRRAVTSAIQRVAQRELGRFVAVEVLARVVG